MKRITEWMSNGLKYSLLLHGFVILNLLVVIYNRPEPTMPERIVTVDLVNIKSGPVTNLKNAPIKAPVSNKPSVSKAVSMSMPAPKTSQAVKTPAPAKLMPAAKVSPAPSVPAVAKPAAPPPLPPPAAQKSEPLKSEPEPKSERHSHQPDDSDRLPTPTKATTLERPDPNKIRSTEIEPAGVNQSASSSKYGASAMSDKPYDRTKPLTIAVLDSIRMQIERYFVSPIVLDFQPKELIIEIKVGLSRDGEVGDITVMNPRAHSAKHYDAFLSLADSLSRAARKASPLQGLPPESYDGADGWNEVLLTFDAHQLAQIG